MKWYSEYIEDVNNELVDFLNKVTNDQNFKIIYLKHVKIYADSFIEYPVYLVLYRTDKEIR